MPTTLSKAPSKKHKIDNTTQKKATTHGLQCESSITCMACTVQRLKESVHAQQALSQAPNKVQNNKNTQNKREQRNKGMLHARPALNKDPTRCKEKNKNADRSGPRVKTISMHAQ